MVLLDPTNCFPLPEADKLEMLHFNATALELTWMYQNKKMRGGEIPDILKICTAASRLATPHNLAAEKRKKKYPSRGILEHWPPPPPGFLKVNFDSSFVDDCVVAGIIVRNAQGSAISAWTGCSIASSPFAAEAVAAYQALKWAEDNELQHIVFEGDALNVVLALNGVNDCIEWQGKHRILLGRTLLKRHVSWTMTFIR